MSLPEHVEISVEAVGGMESEAGQEMLRLLLKDTPMPDTKELEALVEPPKQIESKAAPEPEPDPEAVLGADLEKLFQATFNNDSGRDVS